MTNRRDAYFDDVADLSSLDPGTICAALLRLTVPTRAAWAIIWLPAVDRAGRVRLQRHQAPARRSRRRTSGSAPLAGRLGVRGVIASGSTVHAFLPADGRADNSVESPDSGLTGPALTIPLRDKRGVVGALSLGQLTSLDASGIQELADRAGVALANAARFRAEHAINRELQELLAPAPLPSVRRVDLAARLVTATPRTIIGGDWYDAVEMPGGQLALTIGDVVGHGLGAAVEMTHLRTGLRHLALEGRAPAEVLADADSFLRRTGKARFVTCLHGVYRPSTGELDLANAGHLPPVHLPVGDHPRVVGIDSGLPLGGAADLAATATVAAPAAGRYRMTLQPGESLVMFTDGLVETRGSGADAGIAALVETLDHMTPSGRAGGHMPVSRRRRSRRSSGPSAAELCEHIVAAMHSYRRKRDDDDIAVLVLRRRHLR